MVRKKRHVKTEYQIVDQEHWRHMLTYIGENND